MLSLKNFKKSKKSIFDGFESLDLKIKSITGGASDTCTGDTERLVMTHIPSGMDNVHHDPVIDDVRGDWDDRDAC